MGWSWGARESWLRGLGPSCCPVQGTVNPHTQGTPCPGGPTVVGKLGELGADTQTYSPASNLEALSHRCPPGGPPPGGVWVVWEGTPLRDKDHSSLSKASSKLSYEMGMTISDFNGGRSLQTRGDVSRCPHHQVWPSLSYHPMATVTRRATGQATGKRDLGNRTGLRIWCPSVRLLFTNDHGIMVVTGLFTLNLLLLHCC